jgi:hypothetical protein
MNVAVTLKGVFHLRMTSFTWAHSIFAKTVSVSKILPIALSGALTT